MMGVTVKPKAELLLMGEWILFFLLTDVAAGCIVFTDINEN